MTLCYYCAFFFFFFFSERDERERERLLILVKHGNKKVDPSIAHGWENQQLIFHTAPRTALHQKTLMAKYDLCVCEMDITAVVII